MDSVDELEGPIDAVHGIAAGALAHSLLDLLDRVGMEIDRDAESAKLVLQRASSILRIELERRSQEVENAASFGGLAPWQVKRVTDYIDDHLSDYIPVKELGEVARRSTSHFCRAFKRTMGETPYNFINRRRLAAAERMMLTGDAPLSEIAISCGFSDQSHFCNKFREATGKSPAVWRRERRERAGYAPAADWLQRA
jgi:AraC family transcriptional regulator